MSDGRQLYAEQIDRIKEEKHREPTPTLTPMLALASVPKARPTENVKTKIIRDIWKENRDVIVKDALVFFRGKQLCLNQNALAMFYRTGLFMLDPADHIIESSEEAKDNKKTENYQLKQQILKLLPNDSLALCVKGLLYLFRQPNEIQKYYKEDQKILPKEYSQKGFELLKEAANKGNAAAQFILGVLYERSYQDDNGHFVIEKPDVVEAFKWYRSAYHNGIAYAHRASQILFLKNRDEIVKLKDVQPIAHLPHLKLNADEQKTWQASPFYEYQKLGEVIKIMTTELIPGNRFSRKNIIVIRRPTGGIAFITEGLSRRENFALYPIEIIVQFDAFEVGESIEGSWCYQSFLSLVQTVAQRPELLTMVDDEYFVERLGSCLVEEPIPAMEIPAWVRCADDKEKAVFLMSGHQVFSDKENVSSKEVSRGRKIYFHFKDGERFCVSQFSLNEEMVEWFSHQLFQALGFSYEKEAYCFSNNPQHGIQSSCTLFRSSSQKFPLRKIKYKPNASTRAAENKEKKDIVDFSTKAVIDNFVTRANKAFHIFRLMKDGLSSVTDRIDMIILVSSYLYSENYCSLDYFSPLLEQSTKNNPEEKCGEEVAVSIVVRRPTFNILEKILAAHTTFPFKKEMQEPKFTTRNYIASNVVDLKLLMEDKAIEDDAEAQNYIAHQLFLRAYQKLEVNRRDMSEAMVWLRKAAINGHPTATIIMGLMFGMVGLSELGMTCLNAAKQYGSKEAEFYFRQYYASVKYKLGFVWHLGFPQGVVSYVSQNITTPDWFIHTVGKSFASVGFEISQLEDIKRIDEMYCQERTNASLDEFEKMRVVFLHWSGLQEKYYAELRQRLLADNKDFNAGSKKNIEPVAEQIRAGLAGEKAFYDRVEEGMKLVTEQSRQEMQAQEGNIYGFFAGGESVVERRGEQAEDLDDPDMQRATAQSMSEPTRRVG